jgi:hypothetical protein
MACIADARGDDETKMRCNHSIKDTLAITRTLWAGARQPLRPTGSANLVVAISSENRLISSRSFENGVPPQKIGARPAGIDCRDHGRGADVPHFLRATLVRYGDG